MNDARLPQLSLAAFLERLSTHDPVPGGGSAAAFAGAMGAALLHMVVELTAGRPAAAADEAELAEIGGAAATWQSELLRLTELDAAAYDGVIRARRLPRSTEREVELRRVQVQATTQEATRVPLEVMRRSDELLALAERLAPIGNRNAISDVGVAGLLAATAIRGGALNVGINLPYLADDDPLRREAADEIGRLMGDLADRERVLRATVEERLA